MKRELAAKVVRVQLDEPLQAVEVEARYEQVLLVVQVGEQIVGQVWVGARRVLSPALQWQAISQKLAPLIWRAKIRGALAIAGLPEEEAEPVALVEPTVSVIVCTRDRTDQLRSCLEAIAGLRTKPMEVLVVDNCPSDGSTRALCEELPVRYVREPLPGQARAQPGARRVPRGGGRLHRRRLRRGPGVARRLGPRAGRPVGHGGDGLHRPTRAREFGAALVRGARRVRALSGAPRPRPHRDLTHARRRRGGRGGEHDLSQIGLRPCRGLRRGPRPRYAGTLRR